MVCFQFRIFMYSDNVSDHKLLKKISMKSPCKIQEKTAGSSATVRTGLWRHPDAPQCIADNDEDFRTSEQHRPDARSINIQQGVGFQKSTMFGKSLQIVRTTWQHVQTMSSSSEYSRVPFKRGKDFSEDCQDARSSRLDVNLIKIELRCF
jgi:hypothetical protein